MEWARGKYSRGAVKMHTLLDLRGSIPMFTHIGRQISRRERTGPDRGRCRCGVRDGQGLYRFQKVVRYRSGRGLFYRKGQGEPQFQARFLKEGRQIHGAAL